MVSKILSTPYNPPDKEYFVKQNYPAFKLYTKYVLGDISYGRRAGVMQIFNLKGLNQSKYEMLVSKTKEWIYHK